MDETSKLQLTPEQVELAQAKENLQIALGVINNELHDITKYLPNVDRAKQLDFVHGDLVRIQEIMDNYLYAAKCSLQTYSLTRKRLISFADKDDIIFIPRLLTPTKHNVETVLQVLKELKTLMYNHKTSETSDLLEEVVSSYYFFKRYYDTLSGMYKEYEKLYDEIYHCEKEEYGKRFVGQSLSYGHQLKSAVRSFMHEHDPLFYRSIFGIDSKELIVIDGETRTPFTIENLGVVAINKKVSMTTRLECDMDALARMQYSIKESIKQMIPNITEEEFSDETNLAFRIHSAKLLHHQVNSIIGGYYQLHYLDSVKNELYAQVKPKKKRGPKKCTDFEIFDKDMLREVFQMNYETEKSNFHGGSVNNYAGAFLIAMFRGEADKACLRVAPFSRLLNRLLTKFQLCERTVQEFINRYNFICSKSAKFMTNAMLKCKEVVSRLIPKLEAAKLIFA